MNILSFQYYSDARNNTHVYEQLIFSIFNKTCFNA